MIKIKSQNSDVRSGFVIVEILVAFFVFSVLSALAFMLSFGSQFAIIKARAYQHLLAHAQDALEKIKFDVYENLSGFEVENEFVRTESNVSLFYDYTKKVNLATHSLSDKKLRPVEIPLLVSHWQDSVGGSTCFRKLPPAESYSIVGEPFLLDANNGATDIDVVRGKAYITIDSASAPNFLVVDVSEKENPEIVSPQNFTTSRRLNALHTAGRYAYVATNSTVRQLQVINIFDSKGPTVLSEYRLPEPSHQAVASSIFYKNEKIYLGTSRNEGDEFHIVDVSNLPNLEHLDSWEVGNKVNSIFIQNNFAFLASVNPYPLRVVDINNPQSEPVKIPVDSPGDLNSDHAGQSIAVLDDFLALGRSVATPHPDYHELLVFSMKQPGELKTFASLQLGESVRDLIFRNNLIITVSTLGSINRLKFFHFNENGLTKDSYEIDLPGKPKALDCEDDILYVVTEAPAKLLIIAPKN